MGNGIKTFSKNGQKAAEIIERIKTPTDKAMSGGVSDIIGEAVQDTNLQNIGAFFASMVTGNKVTKTSFDSLKSTVGDPKKNLFTSINYSTKASLNVQRELVKHTHNISETISKVSQPLLDYFGYQNTYADDMRNIAMSLASLITPPKEGEEGEGPKLSIGVALDTTKAQNVDKIFEALEKFTEDDGIKKVQELIDTTNKLGYVDLKGLEENILKPLNSLTELKYDEISNALSTLYDSGAIGKLSEVFDGFNNINADRQKIEDLCSAIQFVGQTFGYIDNVLDENTIKSATSKINGFDDILIETDNFNKINNLIQAFDNIESPTNDIAGTFGFVNQLLKGFSETMANLGEISNDSLWEMPDKLELISFIFSDEEMGLKAIVNSINKLEPFDTSALDQSLHDLLESTAYLALLPETINEQSVDEIIKSLDGVTKILDKIASIEFEEDDFENLFAAMESLQKTGTKMKESTVNFSNSLADINSIMPTAQTNLDDILNSYEVTAEKVEEVDALTEESVGAKTVVNIESLGKAVLEISAVMLIGTYLLSKNPDMLKTSIKFALALAAFTVIVVAPLVFLSGLTSLFKSSGKTIDYFSTALIKLSFCLMIGTLFYSLVGIKASLYSRMFTKDLFIFVLRVSLVIPLFGLFARKGTADAIEALAGLVVKLSVTMMIGALFMMIGGGKLAKAAIDFSLLLTLFLVLISIPVRMIIKGGLFSNAGKGDALEALGHFVIASSSVMIIGALFMLYENGKLAKYAIGFGIILTAFLFAILSPVKWLLKGGLFANFGKGEALEGFTKFVTMTALVLIVGGLFMLLKGGRMGLYALQFAVILSAFILSLVVSIKLLTEHMTVKKWLAIRTFKKMIEEFTLLLIIGGMLMLIPGMTKNVLMFAAITAGFVLIMALVIKMLANTMTTRSQRGMIRFAWAILIITGSLLLAVAVTKKVTWKDLAKAGALMLGVAVIIAGFALLLGSRFISSRLTTATFNLIKMAIGLGLLGITLALMTRIVKTTDWADIGKVAVLLLMVVGLFALAAIPYVAAVIGIGSTMFILMGLGLLLFAAGLVIMNKIVHNEKADYEGDAQRLGVIMSGIVEAFRSFVSFENLAILLGATIAAVLFATAISLIAIPLLLLHLTLTLNIEKDALKLKVALERFIGALDAITTKDAFAALGLGLLAAILISLICVLLTVAFISIKIALLLNPQKDIFKLKATLETFLEAMVVIGNWDAIGTLALATLASLLISLIGAFLFVGILLIRLITIANPKKDVDKLIETLDCFMKALDIITTKDAFAALGLGVAAALLILLTGAFLFAGFLLIRLIVIANPQGDMDKLMGTLEGFIAALDVITTKAAFASLGFGVAASALIMVIGIMLGLAFGALRLALVGDPVSDMANLKGALNNLADALGVIQDRFGIIGGNSIGKMFGIGKNIVNLPELIVKAGMLSLVLLAIGIPLRIIVKTANYIKENNVDSSSIGTFLKDFTGTITELFNDDSIDWGKLSWKSIFISWTIGNIARAISKMAETVQDIANLKVATEWNDKGKPIRYRELKTKDFKNMVTNVRLMFDAIVKPFLDLCTDPTYKPIIDEFGAGNTFFARIFGSNNTVMAAIALSFKLSKVIGSLAESVSGIANLMIPIAWNDEGVATKFRPMKEDDYNNAVYGIKKILNTMLDAIGEFANGKYSPLIEEFAKQDTGFLAIFKSKSKIGAALEISFKMAELIGSMADSISKYVDLKFPTHFDSTGKPDKFITIADAQFGIVTENIGKVLSLMISAVAEAMELDIMNGVTIVSFWDSRGKRYQKGFENIKQGMTLVGEAAKQLSDIANMSIPIYKNGREVGRQPFNAEDASKAMDVVNIILPAIPKSIKDAMDNMPEGDVTDMVTTKLMPCVELMKNVIDVIQQYANMTFPIKWKDGKAIEYKQFDPAESKDKMTSVFKDVLCGMVEAVKAAYEGENGNGGLKKLLEDTDISEIINSLSPISGLFDSVIKTIQAYVDFKAPVYDKDGKVKSYKTFLTNGKDLSGMLSDLQSNLTTMLKGLVNAALSLNTVITPEDAMKLDEVFESVSDVSDKISKMVKCISDIYNLKIPKSGGFDKEGKPKNGYISLTDLVKDNDTELKNTLTLLFTLVPNAIIDANEKLKNKETVFEAAKEYIASMLESCTGVIGNLSTIMENIQNFKIPTKFDKNGNAIAYIALADEGFDKVTDKIVQLMTAIPDALVDSYIRLQQKIGKTDEQEIVEYISGVGNVLTNMTVSLMSQIPNVIDEYTTIKEKINSLKANEIKVNVGGFLTSIAEMYINILKVFTTEDAKNAAKNMMATFAYIDMFISERAVKKMIKLSNALLSISVSINKIKFAIVDNLGKSLTAINNLKVPSVVLITTKIKKLLDNIQLMFNNLNEKLANKEFLAVLVKNKLRMKIFDTVTKQIDDIRLNVSNVVLYINFMEKRLSDILAEDAQTRFEILQNSIYELLMNAFDIVAEVNTIISWRSDVEISDKNVDTLSSLNDVMFGYAQNIKTSKKILDDIADTFKDFDMLSLVMTEMSIEQTIASIVRISKMIENPESTIQTNEEIANKVTSIFGKKKSDMNKLIKEFSLTAQNLDEAFTYLTMAFNKASALDAASFDNIEEILNKVSGHVNALVDTKVDTFKKEAQSLDKFTKAVNKVNTVKVDRLRKLFEAMEKWSSSIGNLDEFTHALAEELAETLAKLTDEIVDAKKVIKNADNQRKQRQKQLDESINKIDKLMKQTLHVNVSQENGKTISGAWEKPD